MAAAAEQQITGDRLRSFDPRASVNMFRYDLENFGFVLPETRQQVSNEELSYLVEGVGRAARTDFVFQRHGEDMVYFARGQWRPYMSTLYTGLKVAEHEAAADPRRTFMVERAATDIQHAYAMRNLRPGQSYSWYSSFPEREAELYGAAFIESLGFVAERKMGFLYRAICQSDGSIILESQTVDNSDEEAFTAAMQAAAARPDTDMDELLGAYDTVLTQKHGEEYYAGRAAAHKGENAWTTVLRQRELISYLLQGLESIASYEVTETERELMAKRHVYGVWAAFKKRLDAMVYSSVEAGRDGDLIDIFSGGHLPIHLEVMHAYNEFAAEGRVLIGCGGAIDILLGDKKIMDASSEDVFESIFGKKQDDDAPCEFVSKSCPECGAKNVKTVSYKEGARKIVKGACGCRKVY